MEIRRLQTSPKAGSVLDLSFQEFAMIRLNLKLPRKSYSLTHFKGMRRRVALPRRCVRNSSRLDLISRQLWSATRRCAALTRQLLALDSLPEVQNGHGFSEAIVRVSRNANRPNKSVRSQ